MSIQLKVAGGLTLALLLVFTGAAAINVYLVRHELDGLGGFAEKRMEKVLVGEAKGVFTSLAAGTGGTIERGEMEQFQQLLNELTDVPHLQEVGLVGIDGQVHYSSQAAQIHQAQPAMLAAAKAAGGKLVTDRQGAGLRLQQALIFKQSCLECHADARAGAVAGVLYLRYDLDELAAAAGEMESHVAAGQRRSMLTGSAIGLLGLLVGSSLVWLLLARLVRRPVVAVKAMVEELGQGRLDRRLNLQQADELGQMGRQLDAFADLLQHELVGSLQRLARGDLATPAAAGAADDAIRTGLRSLWEGLAGLVVGIKDQGVRIATAAAQVSDSSIALSQGATEQAASLEQITSTMTEISSRTRANAGSAAEANRLTRDAVAAVEQGRQQMGQMNLAMNEMAEAGQNISKIIKTIDEIAFQTNLLALNAAVEAARAGQHGKGFAVVAEEVRNLAARSARAARETAELIEGTVHKTENGHRLAGETAGSLEVIAGHIGKASELMGEIAAVSDEQAQGISEISQGLGQVDQVTQQNTASSEESAAAAESLAGEAEQLRRQLERFQLPAEGDRPLLTT